MEEGFIMKIGFGSRVGLAAAATLCAASVSMAQLPNPDVIVGDLYDIAYYGSVGGVHAFAVGTISCNVGTSGLKWIASTNEHPVIGQNMYRFKGGRFEEIGQSWLKHGFTALTGSVCSTCTGPGGSVLSVGCSDPYSAGLNGGQTSAGPRWQVNASTGYFPYPPANPSWNGSIARRLQVRDEEIRTDLNAGATYFVEGQYVTRDDALAGNAWNNASYRRINLTYGGPTSVTVNLTSTTQRTKPAIFAWKEMDPAVTISRVDIPSDGVYLDTSVTPNVHRQTTGTMYVACKVTDNGNGTYHYEYVVQNITSDRSAGGLRFALPAGVVPENLGFKGGLYHSGDGLPDGATPRNYSNSAWTPSLGSTTLRWATDPFATNPNANAIRWGTLYNFWFDANAQPAMGSGTIELFKPADPNAAASPSEVAISDIPVPGVQIPRNIRVQVDAATVPELIPPGSTLNLTATISPGDDQVQPGSAFAYYRYSNVAGTPYTQVAMTHVEGNTYTAQFPGTGCGNVLAFYIQATGASSGQVTWPVQGAAAPFVRPIGVITESFPDDFETDKSWVGVDAADTAAAAGRWVRADPVGTSYNPGTGPVAIQPADDHTTGAGVNCWFTGQGVAGGPAGAADVDAGKTTLTTPSIDLSGVLTARVTYWRWYFSGTATSRNDPLTVQISNNNGSSWTDVEVVAAAAGNGGWEFVDRPVTLPLTNQMKVRFIAQDLGTDDTVEAAIDDFKFVTTGCDDSCAADWNHDGDLSLGDWFSFLNGYFTNNADFNNDQSTSVQDIFDYLAAYFTGCP
jgi:hypothetical protein